MDKEIEYTKALAASMLATQSVMTEVLAKKLFHSRRDKQYNDEIHGVKHGIHEDSKTL
jgi:hypothetical protein